MTVPDSPQMSPFVTAQVVYNEQTGQVEIRIPLVNGMGDHVLAVLPATPPPADE